VNLLNSASISGAQTATLTINPTTALDAGINYNVVVSGTYSPSVTSSNVSLILNSAPTITFQPTNQSSCLGSSITFGVTATGTNISYQWRKGLVNLVNGVSISGATSASLTINPTSALDVAANYNVVVSGTCSPNATSSNVSLTLNSAPTITVQPTNQTVCLGSSVTFGVTATGTNLSYQWRKGLVNLVNGVSVSGANSASLTINPTSALDVAANYNVVVSGTCSPNATSNNVSLTLNSAPTITVQPTNQTVCLGSSVTFDVTATGTNLSFQWRKGLVNLVNGVSISGANSASLTINPTSALDVAANYNVVVSGTCLPNATSNNVSLTLNSAPIITVQPTNQTACLGSSVTFGVTATGTNLSFQWRKGLVNLVNGVSISGANSASLTINPTSALDVAANYNVVVSGTCLPNATSNNSSLTLNSAPAITVQPTNQTVCLGSSVTFGVMATGTNVSYQWRKGLVNLVNGVSISGANSALLTINPTSALDVAANYNVVVSGTCSPNATSNNVSLTLNSAPTITVQPTNQTVCLGSSVTFDVTATGTNISYQWRKGLVNLVNGVSISGATSATLTINPTSALDVAANYNVVVSGTCLPNAISVNVELILTPNPIAIPTSNSVICDGNPILLSAATVANGTYSWSGPNGFISSEQNPIISNSDTTESGTYSLGIEANGCFSEIVSTEVIVDNCDSLDFFIPEGFSPNGDGINDLFVIRGIQFYPNNDFMIFNRWGDKIFDTHGYLNTWDGKNANGVTVGTDELPVGTYFYVLDLGDGSDIFKGPIYLNR
jgi:gliding motility-associated-like protein